MKDGRSGTICSSRGPFAFSHLDLFSGSGELWQWNLEMDESDKVMSSQTFDSSKAGTGSSNKQPDKHIKPPKEENCKPESLRLGTLEEESEEEAKSTDLSSDESVGNGTTGHVKVLICFLLSSFCF